MKEVNKCNLKKSVLDVPVGTLKGEWALSKVVEIKYVDSTKAGVHGGRPKCNTKAISKRIIL